MNNKIKSFNNLVWGIIDLIYPLKCTICGIKINKKSDFQICKTCLKKFKINPTPSLNYNNTTKIYYDKVWANYIYEGEFKNIIRLFKYKHKLSLSKTLGKLLFNFAEKNLNLKSFDYIMFVPMHRKKLRFRKFNQAEILAKFLANKVKIPLNTDSLIKIKYTRAQVELSGKQRILNIKNSFKLKNKNFNMKTILLVDDVFTTGATVNECSELLKKAGAKRIEVLVLAKA